LNGAAPVVDIWVEWQLAMRICEKLGVSRLFWDQGQEQKGLLSEITKGAVSWDEGNTIGHKSITNALLIWQQADVQLDAPYV